MGCKSRLLLSRVVVASVVVLGGMGECVNGKAEAVGALTRVRLCVGEVEVVVLDDFVLVADLMRSWCTEARVSS